MKRKKMKRKKKKKEETNQEKGLYLYQWIVSAG